MAGGGGSSSRCRSMALRFQAAMRTDRQTFNSKSPLLASYLALQSLEVSFPSKFLIWHHADLRPFFSPPSNAHYSPAVTFVRIKNCFLCIKACFMPFNRSIDQWIRPTGAPILAPDRRCYLHRADNIFSRKEIEQAVFECCSEKLRPILVSPKTCLWSCYGLFFQVDVSRDRPSEGSRQRGT